MSKIKITINKLTKRFGKTPVFSGVDMDCQLPGIYGVSGNNGAGKTTFLKIIAGVMKPTSGEVLIKINDYKILAERTYRHTAFAAPYLNLYDEFSAEENLRLTAGLRSEKYDSKRAEYLLHKVSLYSKKNELLKNYSSGMKQKVKLINSLLAESLLIIWDEPFTNMDSEGKEAVTALIRPEAEKKIILIASNREDELALCGSVLDLNSFSKKGN